MAAIPLRLTTERDDPCPVPDEILGRLYRAHAHTLSEILASLPASQRVNLAVFCYGRAHLREIGIAIAATCEHEALVRKAGRVGEVLFDLSRDKPASLPSSIGRRAISLSAGTSVFHSRAFKSAAFADMPDDAEEAASNQAV
jgi:hypothetical protein